MSEPRLTTTPDSKVTEPGKSSAKRERIVGWPNISERLTELAGFPIGVDRTMRFAKRARGKLPVRKFGKGAGPVVADAAALARWVDKQWSDIGPADDGAPQDE